MVTADGVKDKIRRLINTANATTGKTDVTLTTAVNSLVEGFGQGGDVNGLAYDMGEFVLDADVKFVHDVYGSIPHALGETPEFVVVWTDDFAELSAENPSTQQANLGYVWLNGLTGLQQRLTSAVINDMSLYLSLDIPANAYAVSAYAPTSTSYCLEAISTPTEKEIFLPYFGSNKYWRAGITYKYFVSKAWWNVGGAASAE